MKILIFDDEPLIVEGIRACLYDHTIETAYTGREAIELGKAFEPDLILADVRLPDISGIEVIAELETVRECPVIFLTAYSDNAILEKAKQLKGTYGYLVKPVDEQTLLSTIAITMAKFKDHEQTHSLLRKAEQSLRERKLVERAKGILMEQMNLSEPKAMKMLQDQSKKANRKLIDTAKWVIEFFGN